MNVEQALNAADESDEEGLRGLYPSAAQVLAAEVRMLRDGSARYDWLKLNAESDHEKLSLTLPTLYTPSLNFSKLSWSTKIDEAIDIAISNGLLISKGL